jgi:chromosome segregation ATPase
MSKPAMRLVDATSPPRTPEREQLAEAITRHAEATDRLAAVQAARERTEQARRDAKEAIAKATAGIEQAKIDAAAQLVGGAVGGVSVKAARAALQDCEDSLEAAVSAGSVLAGSTEEAERELANAERGVDSAVEGVVKASAEIRALVARLKPAYIELTDVRNALRAMQSRLPDDLKIWGVVDVPSIKLDELKLAPTWRAALAALVKDADAPLPTS